MADLKITKPQPTLKGYQAWAFEEFIAIHGMSPAEGAAYLIGQWFQDNRDRLAQDYEISISRYREEAERAAADAGKLQAKQLQDQVDQLRAELDAFAQRQADGSASRPAKRATDTTTN